MIGGFTSIAHGRLRFAESIDLTIAQTIENCTALTEALLSLDAKRCLSHDHRPPLERRHAPTRMFDREYGLETAAGGVDLRLPRQTPGCPPYLELSAASTRCALGYDLQITVASLDHLTQMREASGMIDAWRTQGVERQVQLREAFSVRDV